MKITNILTQYSDKARNNTGNLYYDKSYPQLLKAADSLKRGRGGENEILTVAHGIVGWNRGYGTAPNAAELINKLSDVSELAKLVGSIAKVEDASSNSNREELSDSIRSTLRISQEMLMIKSENSVTVASKLLHFFSPIYFPPLDKNVLSILKNGGISDVLYPEYMISLIEIGVAKSAPNDEKLSIFWSWLPIVTPLRAIDCTLYVAGKSKNKSK